MTRTNSQRQTLQNDAPEYTRAQI